MSLERAFHEEWLGQVQPDGLVVAVPALEEAQCMQRQSPQMRLRLIELCKPVENDAHVIHDLDQFLDSLLELRPEHFDRGSALPSELELYVPEGQQKVRPTLALRRDAPLGVEAAPRDDDSSDDAVIIPAARAGRGYVCLVWDVTADGGAVGLDLDKPEKQTGGWEYPASGKFERLLRHCQVPIGLLTNRTELRLVYAPHGEAAGSIRFPIGAMADTGGRPILDAFIMLLSGRRWFAVEHEHALPQLLAKSREYQAGVTNELAEQVFQALELLLDGFESAAQRDGWSHIEEALRRNHDHLFGGLLTVLMRTVFLLYAEDAGLMPMEHPTYAGGYSVLGLYERLRADADAHPDTMGRRFGAWHQLTSTWRAVYLGVQHGTLRMPARRGDLFDPNTYPFLEGWEPGGSAPIRPASARAAVKLPSVSDGVVYQVLDKLLVLDRQRLSYRALEIEQIGSVYEALMGYGVNRLSHRSVCLNPQRAQCVWVSGHEVLAVAKAQRATWLQDEAGLTKNAAAKLAKALEGAKTEDHVLAQLEQHAKRGVAAREAGRLVVQPRPERRRTSSHFTPRKLTEPVVAKTLEPLLAVLGPDATAEQLLSLKICDPAMGTGAFLVEVCRQLGDRVHAAWERAGKLPEINAKHANPTMHARRLVAQRCVYGVDKNKFAVHLARISLWLATLAKDLPFTFLDHALRHGDSLVGFDARQIQAFHWSPEDQQHTLSIGLDGLVAEAVEARQRILDAALDDEENDPGVDREKFQNLRDAQDAIERLRLVGDVLVGAFFSTTNTKAREQERKRRADLVQAWLHDDEHAGEELRQLRCTLHDGDGAEQRPLPPFHWHLEFPEIFIKERPDPLDAGNVNGAAMMDAFVGNPPFLGGSSISGNFGDAYLELLKEMHTSSHGNADLCVHFFRRVDMLLGRHGSVGLVATNTIGQGDTRSSGLQYLLTHREYGIYSAIRNMMWPSPGAAVTVSVVYLARGRLLDAVQQRTLSDFPSDSPLELLTHVVPAINSRLRGAAERPDPQSLHANEGLSFKGSMVYGMGFTLTPEERDALIKRNRKNAERIFPYLGGEEVNTNPDQSFDRYVINFGQMDLDEAARWPDLLAIVREKVKPERDKLKNNPDGRRRKEYWWQFGRDTPALFDAIRDLPRCLVTCIVSKHVIFSFQPVDRVFSHRLYVFPLQGIGQWSVLQSRTHEFWARLLSSTLETRINYSATDCFENFPFPQVNPRAAIPELEDIGQRIYDARAQYMLDTQQGLTKTYNALKDPACEDDRILDLRRMHIELDRAVLRAYGWDDIAVPAFTTPSSAAETRAFEAFEDEVLDRLFALNIERAHQESLLGTTTSKRSAQLNANTKAASKPKRGRKPSPDQFVIDADSPDTSSANTRSLPKSELARVDPNAAHRSTGSKSKSTQSKTNKRAG